MRQGELPKALKEDSEMKHTQSGDVLAHVSQSHIDDIKAGLAQIMQGCMTLNRALTMMQVPKPPVLHDAHVQEYYRSQRFDKKSMMANSSFEKGPPIRGMII